MNLPWHPSPNYASGGLSIEGIVIHSVECPLTTSRRYADSLSGPDYFGSTAAGVSAHALFGPEGGFEMVKPSDAAWHVGTPGNHRFYGIEHTGEAAFPRSTWASPPGIDMLKASAEWAGQIAQAHSVPLRFLTDDQVRNRERGFLTHDQVTRCIGGTTHTDPGGGFPYDLYAQYLGGSIASPGPAHSTEAVPHNSPTNPHGPRGPHGYPGWFMIEGTSGPNIRSWQEKAGGLVPDGMFGAATLARVKAYQRANGLTQTGILGVKTWPLPWDGKRP